MPETHELRTSAARALRELGHLLVAREIPVEVLADLADTARSFVDTVAQAPPRERDLVALKRRMFETEADEGEPMSHFDECFVSGAQNPLGIAMEVRREDEEMVASVELGPAFEGAPGRSHGGIVAAVFDDLMGYLLSMLKQPAFTGELSVRYLAPTPIERPLEFRARVVGQDGRRIVGEADARADGGLVAQATATFIAVSVERLRG